MSRDVDRRPPRYPANRVLRRARRITETVELRRPRIRRERAPSPLIVVWGLLGLIVVGTLLLSLPVATASGDMADPLTALFTATSAACVTGLVVVDTQEHWSLFGEATILLLIQLGGLGFLTSSTLILLAMGRQLSLRDRLLVREAMGDVQLGYVLPLLRRIVAYALAVEAVGAVLLAGYFLTFESPPVAIWYGVFHSISAFNNAGLDLFGGFHSLTGFHDETALILVVSTLIVLGGLGYVVVADLWRRRRFSRMALDSKLILVTSAALLVVGGVGFFAMERHNGATLGALPLPQALMQAWFFAVTPRTAGFATLNVADFQDETLFFLMGLMFIGAAPGSTAGGIKVTSLALLAAAVISAAKGRTHVVAFEREIPQAVVMRALTVAALGLVIVANAALALTVTETFSFIDILFETTSAFGTVGLSTGITPELSTAGRLLVIATMFVGRLGPLTLAFALARRAEQSRLRYGEEPVRIG